MDVTTVAGHVLAMLAAEGVTSTTAVEGLVRDAVLRVGARAACAGGRWGTSVRAGVQGRPAARPPARTWRR